MFRWFVLAFLAGAFSLQAQVYEGKTLVTASLIADTTAVVPGQPFQVGVLLEMAPKWHTYWAYAGDAGIPTTLQWTLPTGFAAGEILWPLPRREKLPGDIEDYTYNDKVLLMVPMTSPPQLTGNSVTLQVNAKWLVCAELCIPGSATLKLTLPVAAQSGPANAELFESFRRQLPSVDAPPYSLSWKRDGQTLSVAAAGLGSATAIDLFPLPVTNQIVSHPVDSPVADGHATVSIETDGNLRGVLVVENGSGRQGWHVSSTDPSAAPKTSAPSTEPAPQSSTTLWKALLYGFLGGLILNLMPCVLPVISLKIFGFIRQAGDHPEKILRHGLAFVAGIFAWFMALGLVIVVLKSAGHEVTWAFQFQNPWFNLIISTVVFIFALNLFGVFEIILPGSASNALAGAEQQEGYLGSFSQGLFATLLATPCTAPFLGTALGFAFSQSAAIILLMFASVALGMSAPYFLLSAQPGWMKILPKPGAWMERVKQLMGFPLLATLVWLLWILGGQTGLDGTIATISFLLCVGLACWLYGAFGGPFASVRARIITFILVLVLVVGGGKFFLGSGFAQPQAKADAPTTGIPWVPFSQKALADLLAAKKPVFVDFTADWCISCKFNERTAIDVPAVQEAFQKTGITPMRGDWTNANPEITAELKKFGRVGVPFYILYPAGRADQPIILPELLTQQIVLDALAKAN